MKMVKSLLLSSAAGLAAVTAGQAADLPVKAKPVEYVKVCSLYGAGFYYMPGTDICLKIGGYVRAETTYFSNGNFAAGPVQGNDNNRITSNMVMRARAYITADGLANRRPLVRRGRMSLSVWQRPILATRLFLQFWASTARSSNGRESQPVSHSHSLTSTAQLPWVTAPICRRQIPVTQAGGSGLTPPSWAMASPQQFRPNSVDRLRSAIFWTEPS
jgi:hypothetical protein